MYEIMKYSMKLTDKYVNTYIVPEKGKESDCVPYPESCIFTANFRLYTFKNAFVFRNGIATNTQGYNFYRGPSATRAFSVKGHVSVAITANKFWNTFGHNLHDVIASIIAYPQEILDQNPFVFHDWNDEAIRAYLDMLGLNNVRLYPVYHNEFVHCDILYSVIPQRDCHEFSGFSLPRMRNMFRSYLKLDTIEPTDYCILNKKPDEQRHFYNVDKLRDALNQKYPSIKFTIYEMEPDLKERARSFAYTKFLIVSGGSIAYNSLFMKEKSALVVLYGHLIDLPNNALCCMLGIYSIGIHHKDVNHYIGKGFANITKVMDAVDKLMYAQKNGKYPDMKNYFIYDVVAVYNKKPFYRKLTK